MMKAEMQRGADYGGVGEGEENGVDDNKLTPPTAAATTKINCEEPEQLNLQYNRHLGYIRRSYEIKQYRIPRVQNNTNVEYKDDVNDDNNDDFNNVANDRFFKNPNNDTIKIDTLTTITKTTSNICTTKSMTANTSAPMLLLASNCGGSSIGANCSNCRNIKILLRLSLRYFYDINCEFVKNII